MEYFRHSFIVRTMAVVIAVVLQFDMLDYLKEKLSLHASSASIEQTVIQDADNVQDNGISQSFQHARSLKKVRTRVLHLTPQSLYEPIINVKEIFSQIPLKRIIQQGHNPLRNLFCVFRI